MAKHRQFILSVVVLILGMTLGFFFLSLAYAGPRWVVFVGFLVYFLIAFLVIRFSWRFARELKELEHANNT